MSTLTVLGTAHSEGGACTPEELYKIIKEISPEVIFCEASHEKLPKMLKATHIDSPEMNVIRRLIKEESCEIVPVDVNEDPFDKRLEAMFSLFKRKMKVYSNANNMLLNETHSKGFTFLNSVDSDRIFRDKNSMEKFFVEKVKYKELSDFYSDWLKWNDLRENQWINLIHDYFQNYKSKKAILLVGANHRYRLIDKIKNKEENGKLFLVWDFFHFK